MLNNLRWNTLSVESLNDSESSTKRDFVEAHMGALHNVVRRIPAARAAFRQRQAVDVVQKFRAITEHPVTIVVCYLSRKCFSLDSGVTSSLFVCRV